MTYSKYTVQKIANGWKKKNLNNNTNLEKVRNNENKKERKKEKQTNIVCSYITVAYICERERFGYTGREN